MRTLNLKGKRKKRGVSPTSSSSLACAKTSRAGAADRRLLALCAAFFLMGIITGSVLYSSSSELLQSYFGYLLSGSVAARASEKLALTVLHTLIPQAASLLLCCVFSYCTLGAPLILLLLACSGASTGLICAYIFAKLGWSGVFFNLIVIAPASALASLALINLSIKGIRASITLYYIAYRGHSRRLAALNDEIYHSLALGAAASFVASLIQGALFKLFGSSLV